MRRSWISGFAVVLGVAGCSVGCSSSDDGIGPPEDVDLTSLSARERILTFEGVVYVQPKATEEEILEAARMQTQTAFGALLASQVSVRTREVQNVDTSSLRKRTVTVVDTNVAGDAGKPMLEVRYKYRDEAVVPIELARHTALSLALLAQGSEVEKNAIVEVCTKNDKEAREDANLGLLWYDFDPNRATCRDAIKKEQRRIDADTQKLTDPDKQISKSRAARIYLPTTMKLESKQTSEAATYPEYDRLFSGGADPDALVVALVNGRMEHDRVVATKDGGYYEWLMALDQILQKHPEFAFTKIEPKVDFSKAEIDGKKIEGVTIENVIDWMVNDRGWPAGIGVGGRNQLAEIIGEKLADHWLTFEKKVSVKIGDRDARDFTLRIETMFGAGEDPAPHRRAVNRGDVVVYNGHSYIGYGPLDPDNFTSSHFTNGYQLLFFDSCVSYNYYEKDFFTLKEGGSKNVDLITNGLEAPEEHSGLTEGRFISKLLDGSLPSYKTLLETMKETDTMRVVDGEIDNKYRPSKLPIRITPR